LPECYGKFIRQRSGLRIAASDFDAPMKDLFDQTTDRRAEISRNASLTVLGHGGFANAPKRPTVATRLTDCSPPHPLLPTIDGGGTVIRFRPRPGAARRGHDLRARYAPAPSPVRDIDGFESAPESEEDYRTRMRVNLVAAVFLMLLMTIGGWVFNAMVEARQAQYCYLHEPGHCAPSYIPFGRHS
jgi:hypothetical protein